MPHEQSIIAIASLFFGAKLKGLCEEAGYEYKGAIGLNGALKRIEEYSPACVLIDLSKDDIDICEAVTSIRCISTAPIVAFCGHVAIELLQNAKDCGCDVVTTNGEITGSFERVLKNALMA